MIKLNIKVVALYVLFL